MRAMGLSRLVLVAPQKFPDPDADARAAGAIALLRAATVVPALDAALAGATLAIGFSARPREFAGAALPVRAAAQEALRHAAHGEVAVVFGSEMSGLSNDDLARCQIVATIPGEPGQASLNLAAAVQVAAYELLLAARGEAVWTAPAFAPAALDEIEALFAHVVPEPRAAELSHRSVAVLLQLHECSRSMLNVERSTCVPRQFVTGNWNSDRYTIPVGSLVYPTFAHDTPPGQSLRS